MCFWLRPIAMSLHGHLGRRRFQPGNFHGLPSPKWSIFLGLQWGSVSHRRTAPSHRTGPSPRAPRTITPKRCRRRAPRTAHRPGAKDRLEKSHEPSSVPRPCPFTASPLVISSCHKHGSSTAAKRCFSNHGPGYKGLPCATSTLENGELSFLCPNGRPALLLRVLRRQPLSHEGADDPLGMIE